LGDISEYRGIIVIGSFLACFSILSGLMYSAYALVPADYRELETPGYVDVQDVLKYNYSDTVTVILTDGGTFLYPEDSGIQEFGGWYIMQWWWEPSGTVHLTSFRRYGRFGPFYWKIEDGDFINDDPRNLGLSLSSDQMQTDYDKYDQMHYLVEFDVTQINIHLFYNTTAYTTVYNAWENANLTCIWGITWDQVKTAYSAWDIIGMVLWWQLPNTDIYTQALISTPIYLAFAYIAFILILRAIGAIFGGGA